ncbi:hypothetical protein M0805_009166, partial [Coniferiporia weirii]
MRIAACVFRLALLLLAGSPAAPSRAAPAGFPASGNGLWYDAPGSIWSRHLLPVGNGFLAAMTPGGTTSESTQLNIESLWSGGPFADPTYNGGNKQPDERDAMAADMQTIRQNIFDSSNGTINDVNVLTTTIGAYGSYSGAGYLVSTLAGSSQSNVSDYGRFLDLNTGIAKATWSQAGETFTRETFCSNPARACVQRTATADKHGFTQTYALAAVPDLPTPNISCADSSTLRLNGAVADPGMAYELLATVIVEGGGRVACAAVPGSSNATITVTNASAAHVVWVGGTNYDAAAGDAAHNFTFQGVDPHDALAVLLGSASAQT